jgi:RNA polymerase sigma-70 factor (ECF subfamily)
MTLTLTKDPPKTGWEAQEEQSIARAQTDPQAFGVLYDHYIQPVYRYLLSRVGSVDEAQDITSQTFLAAIEALPRYRHKGYFGAWLFTIANRKLMDHYRQAARRPEADPLPVGGDPLNDLVLNERQHKLQALLRDLPPAEQELLGLRYVAGLSFGDMAVMLHRSQDAVKKSLYRLVARLQNQMEEYYE